MDEDTYDMQPAEPLDFDSENDEEGECDMDQVNAFTLTDGMNGLGKLLEAHIWIISI